MRATRPDGSGDHDLVAWERILAEYAALQRSVEGDAAVGRAARGRTPDGRPAGCPMRSSACSTTTRRGPASVPDGRAEADAARLRLRGSAGVIRAAATDLASAGVAAAIQHDDLHGGNILVGPAGDRFFDWGDAVVAHPFGTLTTTFNSIAHKTGLDLDDPAFARLRDVYLEAWTDVSAADRPDRA